MSSAELQLGVPGKRLVCACWGGSSAVAGISTSPLLSLLLNRPCPILNRVNPSHFCQTCGAPLSGDTCPQCGTFHPPAPDQPRRSSRFTFWLVSGLIAVIAFELASCGVLVRRYLARQSYLRTVQQVLPPNPGPVATPDQLKGSGAIYFVPMGPQSNSYSLDQLAGWLKTKYKLDVVVLPPMKLDSSTWDEARKQYVAELMIAQLKRDHPDLAADPHACLIGFTDADMTSVQYNWAFNRTLRDHQRAAVISAAHMYDAAAQPSQLADQRLQQRLRRILLKDIALLYWHLSPNNDPGSLLQNSLDPDLPVDDIFVSDLDPMRTKWGRSDREPCVFLVYSPKDGVKPLAGDLVRACEDHERMPPDESQEVFEFDLRLGLLISRHTDFYLPDTIPIQFERVLRDGWQGPMGFGLSGTHNYDKFLQSSDMVTIEVVQPDGGRNRLERVPKSVPILSMVKYVDTEISGRYLELRWYGTPVEHFDLKRYDWVETYLPCDNKVLCYQIGLRDAAGQALVFQRDDQRRLLRIASPNKQWIGFTYAPPNHIAEIQDSRGRTVRYGYDNRNRLISVAYPSGEIYSYEYDDQQHLLTFSVAPDAKTPPRTMLRNTYDRGRLSSQTLADGTVYRYSYYPPGAQEPKLAYVVAPDGQTFKVAMDADSSTIWEQGPKEVPHFTADRRTFSQALRLDARKSP